MTGRLEVERAVADWLGSDVNSRISSVPVDTGDPIPPAIADFVASGIGADVVTPGNLAIFDSTRHQVVAAKQAPPAYPALYVMSQGPVLFKGEPVPAGQIRYAAAPVKIAIRYLTANTDVAASRRDGCYTLRAVARSIRQFSKTQLPLVRNGIEMILGMDSLEFYPVVESIGANGRVSGAVLVAYDVRDVNPEY